jgi:hypothetical protein
MRNLSGIEDELALFLQVSDDSGSPCEADEVKRYCQGRASLKEVYDGVGDAGIRLASWIDDRNSPRLTGKGSARLGTKRLTATGLLRYLQQPVWILLDLPLFCLDSATHIVVAIQKRR